MTQPPPDPWDNWDSAPSATPANPPYSGQTPQWAQPPASPYGQQPPATPQPYAAPQQPAQPQQPYAAPGYPDPAAQWQQPAQPHQPEPQPAAWDQTGWDQAQWGQQPEAAAYQQQQQPYGTVPPTAYPPAGSGSGGGGYRPSGRVIAAAVVALVLIAAVCAAVFGRSHKSDQAKPGTETHPSTSVSGGNGLPGSTDKTQIVVVQQKFYSGVNAHSSTVVAETLCDPSRENDDTDLKLIDNAQATGSPVVTGEKATSPGSVLANSRVVPIVLSFEKQSGKWCVSDFNIAGSTTAPGSAAPVTPNPVTSSPATAVHTCGTTPAKGVNTPTLTMPAQFAHAMTGTLIRGKAKLHYKLTVSEGTLSSLCFDNVTQSDLGFLLSFADGGGWKRSAGNAPDQILLTNSDPYQAPKHVFVTATGSLKLDASVYDPNVGSVEIDWY